MSSFRTKKELTVPVSELILEKDFEAVNPPPPQCNPNNQIPNDQFQNGIHSLRPKVSLSMTALDQCTPFVDRNSNYISRVRQNIVCFLLNSLNAYW